MFIIIVFSLVSDRLSGLLSFVPVLLFLILTPLFLSSSFVLLSYFILAVSMRECLEKHACMSSQFPIAILNGTELHFFSLVQEKLHAQRTLLLALFLKWQFKPFNNKQVGKTFVRTCFLLSGKLKNFKHIAN